MLDHESSSRLTLLRFPLIVGVVFVHAYGVPGGVGPSSWGVEWVRNLVSQGLAAIAVPLFFMISGYLFFWGFTWSRAHYFSKLRSRVKTLLVPYLFWNAATLLFYIVVKAWPVTRGYFSGKSPLEIFGAYDYLNVFLGLGGLPMAYPFWFIRDLMVLAVLAPIIYFMVNALPGPFLAVVFGGWLLEVWPVQIPNAVATVFFSLGACLAVKHKNLFAWDTFGRYAALLYVPIVLLDAHYNREPWFWPYLNKTGVLLGMVMVLSATKWVVKTEKLKAGLLWLSGVSFWVYALHEPVLLAGIKQVAYRALCPSSPGVILALYFAIPVAAILAAIVLHRILFRVAPGVTRVITGGR